MTDDTTARKLRERAEAAPSACALDCGYCEPCEDARSRRHDFSPTTVIALLDEIERLTNLREIDFIARTRSVLTSTITTAAANAEIERLLPKLESSLDTSEAVDRELQQVKQQLAAMTAARDELGEIAARWTIFCAEDRMENRGADQERIAELRKVGR